MKYTSGLEEKDLPLTTIDKERFAIIATLGFLCLLFSKVGHKLILDPSIAKFLVPGMVIALIACFWGLYFILKSGLKKTDIRHDCSSCFGGF